MQGWAVLAVIAVMLGSTPARASSYDWRLARLGNPRPDSAAYSPEANARFRTAVLELSGSLNGTSLIPPGSLGLAGFSTELELGVAPIQTSKVLMPTREDFAAPLLVPALHIRKGLPYSFEIGAKIAYIQRSTMFAATLEVRWAFLEGFRALPEAAIRGHITRLINGGELDLTTGGIDLTVGKRFPVGGTVSFTPYVGYNLAWVSASSSAVDFNPGRDPNTSLASPSAQLSDTGVFAPLSPGKNVTHRVYVGLRFGAGIFRLGLEGSLNFFGNETLGDPESASGTRVQATPLLATFGTSIGLSF